ncbi:MAG: autotransporter outer membrane beta-barrel domain-containing protein [Burkholderiaceae bacterium]|nr:autotransporter outer membrane beta-barrel domain-containing protein [Burkholderiaceae bacterium]MCD8565746.1 autotransporter outer membrane beta-barrel domain-containing protein [Burkholderiaceae bacterium]
MGFAYGWFDNNRTPQLGTNGAAAAMSSLYTSSSNMMLLGLRLRAAYEHEGQNHYIKPYVDLDLLYSHVSGYTEGGGALALKANSSSQYNVAISPMVEFGTDLVTDGKRRIKAYVSGGASFLPNNSVSTQMAFANGLAGAGTYDVTTEGPTVLGRLNLGIQAFEANDLEVRAQYGLQFGDGYLSQSLSANLIWRF